MNTRTRKLCIVWGLLSLSLCVGCNEWTTPAPSKILPSYQVGSKPFHFDPHQVTELALAKFNPETGDQWLTLLEHGKTEWKITSEPRDQPILDRSADEIFIFHLLDTLQNIQIAAIAPQGSLESFGLDPPRFAVKWKTPDQGLEFRLGSKLRDGSGTYFTVDGVRIFVASGPATDMLELIDSFKYLRKRAWSSVSADAVDEIELRHKGKFILYAQREGDRWTDKKHRLIQQDMNSFLNGVTTAHAENFIDDPNQSEELKRFIQNDSLFEVTLSDRFGKVSRLKVKLKENRLLGFNSSRPSAVFILNLRTVAVFEKALARP